MSTTLQDVLDFISNASSSDLSDIADEIQENGYEFECYECETHECEEYDCSEDFDAEKREFLQDLVLRFDQFGLADMLQELKHECNRLGVNNKIEEMRHET